MNWITAASRWRASLPPTTLRMRCRSWPPTMSSAWRALVHGMTARAARHAASSASVDMGPLAIPAFLPLVLLVPAEPVPERVGEARHLGHAVELVTLQAGGGVHEAAAHDAGVGAGLANGAANLAQEVVGLAGAILGPAEVQGPAVRCVRRTQPVPEERVLGREHAPDELGGAEVEPPLAAQPQPALEVPVAAPDEERRLR
ncbi:MAG: hypothetical protein QM767_04500 [Anaeromyxobacter sp.]